MVITKMDISYQGRGGFSKENVQKFSTENVHGNVLLAPKSLQRCGPIKVYAFFWLFFFWQ